jgi:hypothetical protein
VQYWRIPVEGHEAKLDEVAKERDYKNRDVINVTKEGLGEVSTPSYTFSPIRRSCMRSIYQSYEQKIKSFFEE